MSFPDQSHINQVRDALWQRSGRASVMIGSGFSRNALKLRPDAHDPPSWQEVAKAVYEKLYPQSDNRGAMTLAEASSTSGFLRLAQEYKSAFDEGALHQLIRQVVRDEDFAPGDIHKRLLRLPWRDVFTTNWDTLLERTRSFVADRAYSVVQNMDEIPLAIQPRIVKLHGSLPAHFPIIFAEEDYRTYPTKFAPFVNTVQQAMMETVFCLIGFSGDDPNFLEWSGWVRDNLGKSAPKIYLAGCLDLSSHRRRMLEDRNVVSIDLAHHPGVSKWPEHLRHQYATEWILHTLERGQPYDVSEWPKPPSRQHSSVPEELQPVEEVVSDVPKHEPEPGTDISGNVSVIHTPSRGKERGSEKTLVRKTLDIWKHNRKLYPGWLMAPSDIRIHLSRHTDGWEKHILRVISEYEPIERLKAIRELIWRREIVLDPISSDLEELAQKTLDEINCQDRTINDVEDTSVDWSAIREAWHNVALALVTVARLRFDRDEFDKRLKALEPFRRDHPDIDQRMHHEQCLWTIYSLDFETLGNLLDAWQTEGCDPAWMIRKAALLIETNRNDDAVQHLNRALSSIRGNPGDDRSVAGPSREGWALWLALPFEQEFGGSSENRIDAPPASQRSPQLAHLKCDARAEMHAYIEAIKGDIEKKEKLSFDLGAPPNREIRFSSAEHYQQIAAYRTVRLAEVAGLPPFVDHFIVASYMLKLSAEKLSVSDPALAARLILRISNFDEEPTLTHVLSRTRVAAMPADMASTLAQSCVSVIEYALPRIVDTGRQRIIFWIERLRVSIEALSRLVLRLEPEMAEEIFKKALEWYRNDYIARDFWMSQPVRHLLERSFEALPETRRTELALDLLGAPIVGLDNFVTDVSHYPDPGYLLEKKFSPPIRTSDNENRWQETISFLIRGLRAGDETRKRASIRIVEIAFWGRLTEAEKLQVAEALWKGDNIGSDDLPSGTDLRDWVFFLLPEPEPGIAEQRFRSKWLNTNDPSPALDLDETLWHVGSTISGLNDHQRSLEFSEGEEDYLVKIVKQWSETPVRGPIHPFDHEEIKKSREAIIGLRSILLEIEIPEAIAKRLYEKIKNLNESDTPGIELVSGIVKSCPDCFDDMATLMRTCLASENDNLTYNAAVGLYYWLEPSTNSTHQLQPPPDDLIREIGVLIATRRKKVLNWALQVAKLVFEEGNQAQQDIICELVLQGLGYLVEELSYDMSPDEDDDVPFLRWNCFQLARAMAECGFHDNPTIAHWLESAESDPLPEVRYAAISASAHQSEDG